jgi:peptidoglycan/LPS O-acetylase OafA/YrhL
MLAGVIMWLAFVWKATEPAFAVFLAAGAFLVVASCALPLSPDRATKALEWRPLAVLGIASYSLYVLHDPIVNRLSNTSLAGPGTAGLLRFALVAVPVCLVAALLSYALIERPFLRLRRRWGPRPASDAAPAASVPSAAPADPHTVQAALSR